jgi:hypothetical protein
MPKIARKKSPLIKLDYERILHRTFEAWLIRFSSDPLRKEWIAFSQAEIDEDYSTVEMERSYAELKGLEDFESNG